MKNKKMIAFVLSVFALFFFTACGNDETAMDDGTLTVGMELQYPPFETTNAEGEPEGISVDMAKDLASYLGTSPETISRKFKELEEEGLVIPLGTNKLKIPSIEELLFLGE